VFALSLPPGLELLSFSPYLFMAFSPVAGLLTGAFFPLAARISLGQLPEAGTVAGLFDGADHLGGLAGAACTGLIFMPALGMMHTALLVALLECAGLMGLALAFWGRRSS